ncbi:hypothetical protein FOCC_FOCC001035, partial [Frankliniella occidentalis]
MTVGLWGCVDSCLAAVTFPEAVMFPIHYAAPRTPPRTARPAPPSSRGSSNSNCSSASPPSPPVSPLLAGVGVGPHGGYFRLDVATPPLSSRATSTPGPCAPGRPPSPGTPERPRPHLRRSSTPGASGVVVAEDIPLHAASKTFHPAALLAAADTDTQVGEDCLQLRLSVEGHLDVDADPTPSNTSADSGVSSLSRLSSSLNGSANGSVNGSLNGSLGSNGQTAASPGPAPGPTPAQGLFGAFHHWALSSPALRPGVPTLPLPLPALSPAHHHHSLLPRPLPPPPEAMGLGGLLGSHHGLGATRVRDAPPQHAVQAHQASYHQHASDMETLVSNLGRSKQGHLCIYCGKVYSRKYGLKIHIRTHTGFKPLKCKYCLRPFGDPSNLNKHVRLHAEGDTPYKCDLCGKVLVRRRDLERHVKSRHQDGDWDSNEMDTDNDDAEDDVDVEVDVGEETKSNDEDEERPLHCNGSSLKQQ